MDLVLWLKEWGWVGSMLAAAVIALMGLALERRFPSRAEHEEVARRVDRVEQTLGGLPGKGDLHSLALQISEVKGQLTALAAADRAEAEALRTLRDQVQLLIERGMK